MRNILIGAAAVVFALVVLVNVLFGGQGKFVTPEGEGFVELASGTFEAFPLPDYAAAVVTDDYKSYFVEVEPGIKVHMLEVGSGYPVYLQHGNPTNGLLYRKIAAELPTDDVRLIMPTTVGLGFSTKIKKKQHTVENHIRWTSEALRALDLEEVVYVGQDWGGMLGMGAMMENPDLLKGAVLLNTAIRAPVEKVDVSKAHAMVKTPIVGEILTEVVFSLFDSLPDVQGDPASMPPEVLELYSRPLKDDGNIKAPLTLMRMVPDGPDHPSTAKIADVEAYVRGLDIPAEIIWGMSDPILGRTLPLMREQFPNAPVQETDAGHFIQEERPVEIAAAIMRIVNEVRPAEEPVIVEPAVGPAAAAKTDVDASLEAGAEDDMTDTGETQSEQPEVLEETENN